MSEITETRVGKHWRKKAEGSIIYKIKRWFKRKIVDEELITHLKEVGWELSRIFSSHELAKSTLKSEAKDEANPVHGYILLHYPETYRQLIFDNRVIDLACLYAQRNFSPKILTKIKLEDLEGFVPSLMFIEPTQLKNFPEIVINKAVILSRKNFYDSVSKEDNAEIEWNGWETTGKKIYYSASLLAFISFDIPLKIITHAPGQNSFFYEADFDDVDIQHEKERVLTKVYHQTQVQLATFEKRLDKVKRLATAYAKEASDATKEAERQKRKDFRARLNAIDLRKEMEQAEVQKSKEKWKINWTPIIVAIIVIIGLLIFFFIYFSFQTSFTATPGPEIGKSLSLIKSLRC